MKLKSNSGKEYEVTHDTCTCADFMYRRSGAGEICKHIREYRRMNKMENKNEIIPVEETINPIEVMDFATNAANILKDIVNKAGLTKKLGNKEYMMIEGWQTVGKFFNTTTGIEWTKPVVSGDEIVGFESRAYVKDKNGMVISSAESYCGRDEDKWNERNKYDKYGNIIGKERVPLFQLRSMSQTRACAKALRLVHSWVVVLAGYKPTPLEEMDSIPEESISAPARAYDGVKTENGAKLNCVGCGVEISKSVYDWSMRIHKKGLCMPCQNKEKEGKK